MIKLPAMKIVFLNIMFLKLEKKLLDFINQQKKDTDIFCFQESSDRFEKITQSVLSEYNKTALHKNLSENENYSLSTFVNKKYKNRLRQILFETDKKIGMATFVEIDSKNKLLVGNVHGVWRPGNKLDTPQREKQSQQIIKTLNRFRGLKIVGGDFNLLPDTNSIKMFERSGFVNLIKQYKIKTTRNNLAWKNHAGNRQYFADYVFVEPKVKVFNFKVVNNQISDHLPMIVEIES